MERKFGKEIGTTSVSFICPVGREFDAADVFKELGINLVSNFKVATRTLRTQDGTILRTKGFEFTGDIGQEKVIDLIESLAERKIAGYSRETQIVTY